MRIALFISFFLLSYTAIAQQRSQYSTDTESIENAVTAVLESISGNKGEARDWERFKNLFLPSAQISAVFHRNDSTWYKVNSVDEFVEKAGTWYIDNGFREYAFKNHIDQFGNIAQVFQSYGASIADKGEIQRGVNSFQLVYDLGRWWIVSLIWDSETENTKLPEEYLKN